MKPIVLVSCFVVNCFFCNSFLLACNRGAYRFANMDDNARKAFILFCFAASSSLISNLQIVYTNFHSDGDMNFLNYLIWCALMECNNHNRERQVYPRNQQYYNDLFRAFNMERFFKEHFRLRKESFTRLCELVAPRMERETTQLRAPIPLPIRVGIGLRRLGKGESFESLGVEFWGWKIDCSCYLCRIRGALAGNIIRFYPFSSP